MPSGELRERLTFQKREDLSGNSPPGDGYGNMEGEFVDEFTVKARVAPKLGGEDVLAARLAGTSLVNITLRYSPDTALIRTEWRAVDARDATKIYNIRSIINPDERRRFVEILAEVGVAL